MKTAGLIYSVFIHGVAPTRRSYTGPGGNTDNIARKINIFPLAKIATPSLKIAVKRCLLRRISQDP